MFLTFQVTLLIWYHGHIPHSFLFSDFSSYSSVLLFPPMAILNYGDFSANSSNPYYLHPNESPALFLVSPPLVNKNYHSLARSMHIALISKNKEKIIDGTLPKPNAIDASYAPWIRCNIMILAWLQRFITKLIARSYLWIESTAGVWLNHETRLSQNTIFHISDIQEELYKLRPGSMDVSDYFTKIMVLWDELENYRPILHCKFSIQCNYNVISSL